MATNVTESEILSFLCSVESGDVILIPLQEPQNVFAGPVDYIASNGWNITIYNDCNEWDYIEHIQTADGRKCDYDDIFEAMPAVDSYQPPSEVAWTRYRIPEYCKFRCIRCGKQLRDGPLYQSPYICPVCNQEKNV